MEAMCVTNITILVLLNLFLYMLHIHLITFHQGRGGGLTMLREVHSERPSSPSWHLQNRIPWAGKQWKSTFYTLGQTLSSSDSQITGKRMILTLNRFRSALKITCTQADTKCHFKRVMTYLQLTVKTKNHISCAVYSLITLGCSKFGILMTAWQVRE